MATSTRVLGIDPGTTRTGYGIIDRDGAEARLVKYGLAGTEAKLTPEQRLAELATQLAQVIATHQPTTIAVERLFFATNTSTAMSVAEARGVILLVCAQAGYAAAEYTPLQVKQSVAGYGKATKQQVAAMVCRQLKLAAAPKPDDITDALAIALCHAWWRQS